MLYIKNKSNDPHFNLALEEYVLKSFNQEDSYILLWQNEPSVIIGRNQNTIEEINSDYIKEHNINVVRRLSGGGAVYHDLGNLNFTFITPKDDESNLINFRKFTEPVIKVLNELGVPAEFSGRNDIAIEGKKFSGNAQYYYKDKVLHHGTILFDSDLSEVQRALNVKIDKIQSKGVKSVRSRVTNVVDYLPRQVSVLEFKEHLKEKIFQNAGIPTRKHDLTKEELGEVQKLMEDRYLTWEWNYGNSPDFNLKKEFRFPSGKIEVLLFVKKGIIKECKIYGDFFGTEHINSLEQLLIGKRYQEDEIKSFLTDLNLDKYFGKLSAAEFLNLLF